MKLLLTTKWFFYIGSLVCIYLILPDLCDIPGIILFFDDFILLFSGFFLRLLTFRNSPFNDREVGGEAFLCDGTVCVDRQCQDACVGDDPSRSVLPTVPPNVRANCKGRRKTSTGIVTQG